MLNSVASGSYEVFGGWIATPQHSKHTEKVQFDMVRKASGLCTAWDGVKDIRAGDLNHQLTTPVYALGICVLAALLPVASNVNRILNRWVYNARAPWLQWWCEVERSKSRATSGYPSLRRANVVPHENCVRLHSENKR